MRFDRHKRWKLLEGPAAIRWSPATFIDVAQALGIPVAITISGAPVGVRIARTAASRPVRAIAMAA
ncbi:hypothetical protein ASF08_22915 [Methylobacterium sp. Leaf85]|nr:hypothetical protein ASF08_22915 [Methylobacterium sp. Leaf85]